MNYAAEATKEAGGPGTKPKITKTNNRAIIRAVLDVVRTACEVRDTYNCNVTVRLIQQILFNVPHLKHKKMQTSPSLSSKHKEASIKWAEGTRWRRVLLWGEKNLIWTDQMGLRITGMVYARSLRSYRNVNKEVEV